MQKEMEVIKLMQKFFHCLSIVLSLFCIGIFTVCGIYYFKFPENYVLNSTFSEQLSMDSIASIRYHFNSISVSASTESNENAQLVLFNTVPVKDVTVKISERKYVIPCGIPFGIKIYTEGVLVIKTTNVETKTKTVNPSQQADIRVGDIILSINNQKINNNEELQKCIEASKGKELKVQLKRNNIFITTTLTAVQEKESSKYKAGIWIRDSMAGIGTLTYYDPETHTFGGLGHGICDTDTEYLIPLQNGEILKANINSIRKSSCGIPGSFCGSFVGNKKIGQLISNTDAGVYGIMEQSPIDHELLPVANRYEIKAGKAQILTTVDGETPQYYDIEIESIDYNNGTKNMVICITDQKLIEKTGGIVQGMSGSPIIQNGQLIGAVTHVFVNDPLRGYGIFAENMISNSNIIAQTCTLSAA